MAASLYESAAYRDLIVDRETARLFTDTAEIRAMLLVEGALARAQGAAGLIPEVSAQAIHRATMELQIDPGGLSAETAANGVVVPTLVRLFREAMQAPEHAQWVHYGATSQDIVDTALVLRLRQVLVRAEALLAHLLETLATAAEAHAELPMAGRTYGQLATPTSFGAVVAGWGAALPTLADRLDALRPDLLTASLGGAAGTLSAMGPEAATIRRDFAEGLGLTVPSRSGHSVRQPMAELSAWATQVTGTLARMGEDMILMTQSGIGELHLPGSGGSSTMPQKQNPVLPSLLVAIASQVSGLNQAMQGALVHRQQRDGTAWFAEWLSLPQICLGLNRALAVAGDLAAGMSPVPGRMEAALDEGPGLVFAEALQFRLAGAMPRPKAQAAVKALCAEAGESGRPLAELAAEAHPDIDLAGVFDAGAGLGLAPEDARCFAAAARARAARMARD